MKKFLSLVLALVMTMSLVTISAGAEDFTDNSKINYKEAVDVMSAVKVIDGYADGSFNPQGTLTRGAAAKIICNLILGPTTASALSADTAPYKDVPVNHTFAGYIAYCQQQGIISGYADGTFRPAATLTNYAFMKMLLGALGYDAQIEGYVGDNWSIAVAKRALNIGLDDGLVEEFVGTEAATREEACLYALNTMTADMVQYDSRTSVTVGGAEVVIAGSKAEVVKNTSKTDGNVFAEDNEMQFAEKYFTNLSVTKGSDDFARPSNVWKLKAEKIGTYADEADVTYTAGVKSKDIYKDLDLGSTIDKKDVSVYNNGVEAASIAIKKGSEDKIADADNGVLTEVFYNDDDDTVIVTSVQTYVGTINKSVAAKGDKDAYVEIAPESAPAGVSGILKFETVEEFEDDAYVLYTYSEDTEEVKSVAVAEEVSGTVTKAENSDTNVADKKALTIDGERYKASANIAGENLGDVTVKEDYTIYLDAYGYMIYVEEQESTDYALVLAAAAKSDFVGKKAELLFADGTVKVVNTDKNYSNLVDANGNKTIVTYKVDDDNEYSLKAVKTTVSKPNEGNLILTNDKAGITVAGEAIHANSASVFVVGEEGKDIADIDDYTAYTGIKNAPSIKTSVEPNTGDDGKQANVYYYCKNGTMVTIMFIQPEENVEVTDGVSKTVFLAKESVSNLIHDADGDYFEYNAVVDDEITTVKVDEDVTVNGKDLTWSKDANDDTHCAHGTNECKSYSAHVKATLNGLFKSYNVDKHGIITDLKTYDASTTNDAANTSTFDTEKGYQTGVGIDKVSKEYTVLVNKNGSTYDHTITCDEDATYYYVDKDGEITTSSYKALAQDDDDNVYLYAKDYMVQTLFVEEVNTKNNAQAATVTVSGKATATVGDEVVLTANVTLADSKYDSIQGYQWYMDGTANANKLAGETGKTLTVDTSVAASHTYYVKVTTFNDKVDGKDTAVGTSAAHTLVVSAAPVADMTVTVKTYLRDANGNIPLDENTVTIGENGSTTINAPEYDEYTVYGASSKNVTFVAGGSATVTFVYNAKAVTKIEVTTPPTSTEVTSGGNFDSAGMVVTATYDNGTTADVTNEVSLSGNTNITADGNVTVSYTENGTTVTTTVAVTVAP